MAKPTLVLTKRWPERVEHRLAQRFDVVVNADDHPFSRDELVRALTTADALGATVTDLLDAAVLGTGNLRTRIIGNFGVGFNHIDVDSARAANIVVTNTPGVLTDATADIAMTLILMVARRAGEGERLLRAGGWTGWTPTSLIGTPVTGATLGVVGMGRIGQAVAARARAGFDMSIVYHGPRRLPPEIEDPLAARYLPLAELLGQSDFVTLHCPANAATHHLIDVESLAAMRSTAYLINTARGEVVDTQALIAALETGAIAGAGLDVYEGEPNVPEALQTFENVVLLPHLGSSDVRTREAMGMCVLENLGAYFRGEPPPNRIA